jgi:hypothetical protein
MSSSSIINNITKDVLFISFSGSKFDGLNDFFEFKNFLEENFKIYDKHFFIDHKVIWYNQDIQDISTNMDGTIDHLRTLIRGYKKVVFIGASAGGYTAILC